VDVSDAWFEPRRRRMAISAAGPASDLLVGAVFSIAAAVISAGTFRDILFQLALAAYVGAFFNLNPLLDRDGYQMLVDWLGEPGLRRRSREWFAMRLAGRAPGGAPRAIRVYGVAAFVWSILAVGFVILITTRYFDALEALAPTWAVWSVLGVFYALMFVPVVVVIARPLLERVRSRGAAEPGGAGA
jgi:putative peptide zinc metalloprotease protein